MRWAAAVLAIALAGCGGHDLLSKAVGPNPISGAHQAIQALRAPHAFCSDLQDVHDFSNAHAQDSADQFRSALPALINKVTQADAQAPSSIKPTVDDFLTQLQSIVDGTASEQRFQADSTAIGRWHDRNC